MAKILIVRLGAMGDILHALPAVTGIRAALPDATIGWLVEERWRELLVAEGTVCGPTPVNPQKPVINVLHTASTLRWRNRPWAAGTWREMWAARKIVREMKYDVALDFQGAIKSAFLAFGSGARTRTGFVDPRESAARFLYSETFSRSGEHVIEQDYALATKALEQFPGYRAPKLQPPLLPLDLAAEAWAETQIKQLGIASFALITAGAGWGGKRWPAERYGEVAKALAQHNLTTLVNAAPGEEELNQAVIRASDGHALAVESTVGQLIALTRRARIFLGGDTGPLHLAAALNVPVVGLFGPTDPARTGPFGTRCVVLRHPESQTTFSHHREPEEGLMKITIEEVIAAARFLLGGGNG